MKNIFVIDDNKEIRKLIKTILVKSNLSCKVSTFDCLKGAMDDILKNEIVPDLIISDIMMPGESGLRIIKKLKTNYLDIPVLFITALTGPEIFDDEYNIMSKPFSKNKLLKKASELML